ncbi:hypothetical protein [Ponticaulis koreensis]|nr:hypothetical protein [Ponticaulis koreensis]
MPAGFQLRGIHETKPAEELKAFNPRKYDQNSRFPTFMVLDAVLPD